MLLKEKQYPIPIVQYLTPRLPLKTIDLDTQLLQYL